MKDKADGWKATRIKVYIPCRALERELVLYDTVRLTSAGT